LAFNGPTPPENIHQHGTILHANDKDLLARVQKKETMPQQLRNNGSMR
jgi:hypothetical protein